MSRPPPPPPPADDSRGPIESLNERPGIHRPPPPPPPPPSTNLQTEVSAKPPKRDAKLDEKQRKWHQTQKQKFAKQRKHGFIETQKAELPPEHLRQIMRMHGDMSSKRYRHGTTVHISISAVLIG